MITKEGKIRAKDSLNKIIKLKGFSMLVTDIEKVGEKLLLIDKYSSNIIETTPNDIFYTLERK